MLPSHLGRPVCGDESGGVTSLLALDPGGTTGWSLWRFTEAMPIEHVAHGQVSGGVDGFVQWWHRQDEQDIDEVVSESFVLDGRTASPDITPLRIEGALAVLWPGVIYQRNVYKGHVPDAKIKELGLWWAGEPHAVDSMRHALALMKVRRHLPTLMWAWPPRG